MPLETDPFSAPISKRRPLLGITILLIEDSRFCSEAVRLMTMRSGARLRRADCVRSAHKHLAMYRPDLVIVDLGLPDGNGFELIAELVDQDLSVLAISGTVSEDTRAKVMAVGAVGFLPKPIGNMKQFQDVILASLQGTASVPGFVPSVVDAAPDLDQQALLDDLDHIRDVLEEALPNADMSKVTYCAQFVASIARTAQDQELINGAAAFFQNMEQGTATMRTGKTMLDLVQKRLARMPRTVTGRSNVA
ncbi:response regulator [Amylibacter sp. IMCC11727]|uniref:response regulator n=1 Tax=Amylibacter sp. IMCC11727 TaxID=3039851 RepID=UPI00244DCC97|nr:response regulator [Amylibacter sp. IMCC11727]WGI23040.1 response regulator [Amylibacter sp. IMCC11727]